ncbi:MAG: HDOD domain-containing protein [Nitrospina sp.]|nr:HDOD domain-containing protein [Nitrospina sp.]
MPDILIRLEAKIDDPGGELEEIAQLIETEPVLAGRLLALSNSVFFGAGREKILSLKGAVLRLGLKLVLDLAYTLELPRIFSGVGTFNQEKFWKHSLAVGVLSRQMAGKWALERRVGEQAYLAGLMHDIGILVFYFLIPKEYRKFLREVQGVEKPLEILERETFDICHAELGARFIKKWWPLDDEVVVAVADHHRTLDPVQDTDLVVAAVNIGNAMANTQGWRTGLGEPGDTLNRKYLVARGMTLETYQEFIEEAQEALDSAQHILDD